MEWKSSRNFTILAHLCGWLVFLSIPLLLAPGPGFSDFLRRPESFLGLLVKMAFWLSLFYVNLLVVFPAIMRRGINGWHIVLLVVAVAAVAFAIAWLESLLHRSPPFGDMGPPPMDHIGPPQMEGGPPRRPGPGPGGMFGGPFFSNLLMTILVLAASSFSALWNDWRAAKEIERERTLQKVAAELSMLKLQISPHFLFNTLNNIRWLIRSKAESAETAVVKLSQLLRYILYQASADVVPLKTEIDYLRDFISLQEMRLSNSATFTFEVKGSPGERNIVPLLFLPLAENFFKHGDFGGDFVNTMKMDLRESSVVFAAVNKILPKMPDSNSAEPGGIGISNLKRRLELHYPGRHTLEIREIEGVYRMEMNILL